MGQRAHRKTNDGNFTGLKQDKFRNSEFEIDDQQFARYAGVTRADANTINGPWAENRGRRGDQVRLDNPFENGKLYNWNRGKGPRDYVRSDDRVFDHVCEVLTRDRDLDASGIEVKVESGIVTLTGKVEDRSMKRHAEYLIEHIKGVRDVQNYLEFERR